MKTARIFGISYAIAALAIAAFTTILQVQPSLIFIELLTTYGKFPATLVYLLTALLLLLPGFLILISISYLRRKKNIIPDTTGKTGVILKRKLALYNAAYNFRVMVDGAEQGTVGNGQSIFVELVSGKHRISIKGFESSKFDFDLKFASV
ncbi:MAG: hypothetical protein IPG07_14885 [Crocinitomicaceae bacterium]|nr:hypothetical protein [Crocinitomicaceae bacterium]